MPKLKDDAKTYELRIRKIINMIELKTISITDYLGLDINIKHNKVFECSNPYQMVRQQRARR